MNLALRTPKSTGYPLEGFQRASGRFPFVVRLSSLFISLLLLLPQLTPPKANPATPPNRVLDLDGTSDWMELPVAAFTNLSQGTFEAWSRWRNFVGAARIFDFGERQREMY